LRRAGHNGVVPPTADDKPETAGLTGWELQNSPYSIEGELEGFARFATGARQTRNPLLRAGALVMVAAIVGPMIYGVLHLLWTAVSG
jgi:hypothetical protein